MNLSTCKKTIAVLFVCLMMLMCALAAGCGGGFGGDSANAAQFQQSIFGTDTLE